MLGLAVHDNNLSLGRLRKEGDAFDATDYIVSVSKTNNSQVLLV